jgi:hypothetical protein
MEAIYFGVALMVALIGLAVWAKAKRERGG